jgi:predicted PurR-regulated permease PerM
MAFPDRRTLSVLMTALLFGLVLAIVYVARTVIVIFAFSVLLAYLINPIVRFLQSHSLFFKNLRGPHVAEAYRALLILLGLIVHNLAPQLVPRVEQLVRDSPAMMENVHSGDIAARPLSSLPSGPSNPLFSLDSLVLQDESSGSTMQAKVHRPSAYVIFCVVFSVGGGNNYKRASRIHALLSRTVLAKMSRQKETQWVLSS